MLAVITDSGFPGEVLAQFQKREIIGSADIVKQKIWVLKITNTFFEIQSKDC